MPKALLRGQEAIIQPDSKTEVSGQHDPTGNITVTNNWKNGASVVLGCKCHQNGEDIKFNEHRPYYMSAPTVMGDKLVLTPVQSFSVLFTSSIKVKSMIDVKAKGGFGHFEITEGQNECHVKYDTSDSVGPGKDHWQSVKNATRL